MSFADCVDHKEGHPAMDIAGHKDPFLCRHHILVAADTDRETRIDAAVMG